MIDASTARSKSQLQKKSQQKSPSSGQSAGSTTSRQTKDTNTGIINGEPSYDTLKESQEMLKEMLNHPSNKFVDAPGIHIPGPCDPIRGSMTLPPLHILEMLKYGVPLLGDIVESYYNLLCSSLHQDIGLRVVGGHFLPQFRRMGWTGVQSWVQVIGCAESTWHNAPLIGIPLFTGARQNGHWTSAIVYKYHQKRLVIFSDSLPNPEREKEIQEDFAKMPALGASCIFVSANVPLQDGGGLDCGAFSALILAVLCRYLQQNQPIVSPTCSSPSITITFKNGWNARQWGANARLHMLKSFCEGVIDLKDETVLALGVSFVVPSNL